MPLALGYVRKRGAAHTCPVGAYERLSVRLTYTSARQATLRDTRAIKEFALHRCPAAALPLLPHDSPRLDC